MCGFNSAPAISRSAHSTEPTATWPQPRSRGPANYAPEPTYQVRDNVGELAYLIRDVKLGLPFFRGDEHVRMDVRLTQNAPSC